MKNPRLMKVAACVGASALGVVPAISVSTQPSGAAAAPYQVLVLAALSGPLGAVGTAETQGMKAAANVLNHHGGILGRRVVLTIKNDEGSPTTALNDVNAAIDSGALPNLVAAGTSGQETDAVTPVLTAHKLIDIDPTAPIQSANPKFAPYHFSSNTSATAPNTAIVDQLAASGFKNVAVLAPNNALGTLSLGQYVAALKAHHMTYESAMYPAGGTDFSPELLQLKAANPQALIIDAFGADAATATVSRAKIGWTIPTVGDSPYAGSNVGALVPSADVSGVKEFLLSVAQYHPAAKSSANFKTFYSALRSVVGGLPTVALDVYSFGYDSIMDAAAAAQQAHSVATGPMVKALLHLKHTATSRYVTFADEHFDPHSHNWVLTKADFEIVPVLPLKGGMYGVPAGATP